MKFIFSVKALLLVSLMLSGRMLNAQELYVFTEPASNMPSHSISTKASAKLLHDNLYNRTGQRYIPEVMFGLDKNWMLHGAVSFSNMYSDNLRFESAKIYAKYRFLANDEVHEHFRMAAFAEVSQSRNNLMYDELSLDGDQSGVQGGVIATQLVNRLAVSATAGYLLLTQQKPKINPDDFVYQGYNYSLSAGYLVLPLQYRSFKQTNLNVYAELLGQRATDKSKYFIDFAPALQLIFNSNSKLNLGYRFQLSGNMNRMADKGFLIAFETTFLGAL